MERIRGNEFKGKLKVGQRVHSILYGGRDGIICKIEGEQKPETCRIIFDGAGRMGGNAKFQIVMETGYISHLPECILLGVQWYIYDDFATEQEIQEQIENINKVQREAEEAARKKAEWEKKELEELPGRYPHLIPMTEDDKKRYRDRIIGAKNIRNDLKKHFPGIKFSVKGSSFSGGNSINVDWVDGPTNDEVNELIKKYQKGSFNGMEDIYEYDSSCFNVVFGGAKYVMGQRSISKEVIIKVAKEWVENFSPETMMDEHGNLRLEDREKEMTIYREARKVSCK